MHHQKKVKKYSCGVEDYKCLALTAAEAMCGVALETLKDKDIGAEMPGKDT